MGQNEANIFGSDDGDLIVGISLSAAGLAGVTASSIYWYNNAKKVKELQKINMSYLTLSEFDFGDSKLQLDAALMNSNDFKSYAFGLGIRYNF